MSLPEIHDRDGWLRWFVEAQKRLERSGYSEGNNAPIHATRDHYHRLAGAGAARRE
jgi:hypothetical protein